MSAKIEEIIEVIEEIKEALRVNPKYQDIGRLRSDAAWTISFRRDIDKSSVNDKFIRKLRPEISSIPFFNRLLQDWLDNGSVELKSIMLKHASSSQDKTRIENAFYRAPESDVILADEFGFDPNEKSFKEGKEQLRLHRTKERNRNLINDAKNQWNHTSNNNVLCEACGFSFPDIYGKVGFGFIEAHHKIPIETLTTDTIVRISDLAPVCSNCHSMLHRHRPWRSVEQLREIIQQQKK
jgi:hypothetical protein